MPCNFFGALAVFAGRFCTGTEVAEDLGTRHWSCSNDTRRRRYLGSAQAQLLLIPALSPQPTASSSRADGELEWEEKK